MRFSEIRPCDLCGKPVAGNTRDGKRIDFRRVVVEAHILDLRSLQERAGLALMMGGSELLAAAIGGDARASVVASARELLVCSPCWLDLAETALNTAHHEGKGRALQIPDATAVDDVALHLGGARAPEPAA